MKNLRPPGFRFCLTHFRKGRQKVRGDLRECGCSWFFCFIFGEIAFERLANAIYSFKTFIYEIKDLD